MKCSMLYLAVLAGLITQNNFVRAEDLNVKLVGVKPHSAVERTHVCTVVKIDDVNTGDCNEPKCFSGGAVVDAALASKGLKRICKSIDASVNRGFDVTYSVNGEEHVSWAAQNPEYDLNREGLTIPEEHSPLNTTCPQVTFKEENGLSNNESECALIEDGIDTPLVGSPASGNVKK